MKISTKKIKEIRAYFLENPTKEPIELCEDLKVDLNTVLEVIKNHNYNIVASLHFPNTYFLFTDFFEKTILTDHTKKITNTENFTGKEKMYLLSWGFYLN